MVVVASLVLRGGAAWKRGLMELLGADFNDLVGSLHDRVRAVQAGELVPRVVLLEAPSGSGKSRVIRELYGRLVADQRVNEAGEGKRRSLPAVWSGRIGDRIRCRAARSSARPSRGSSDPQAHCRGSSGCRCNASRHQVGR